MLSKFKKFLINANLFYVPQTPLFNTQLIIVNK